MSRDINLDMVGPGWQHPAPAPDTCTSWQWHESIRTSLPGHDASYLGVLVCLGVFEGAPLLKLTVNTKAAKRLTQQGIGGVMVRVDSN